MGSLPGESGLYSDRNHSCVSPNATGLLEICIQQNFTHLSHLFDYISGRKDTLINLCFCFLILKFIIILIFQLFSQKTILEYVVIFRSFMGESLQLKLSIVFHSLKVSWNYYFFSITFEFLLMTEVHKYLQIIFIDAYNTR